MATERRVSGLDDHLGYWLRYVSNHVSHAFAMKIEARGVTVAEWVLLRELSEAGPVNQSRVAERLGMTRGAVSKLADRLRRKGLIEQGPAGKGSGHRNVTLTPAGEALSPVLARIADENDLEFFGHLGGERRSALIDLFREIVRRHGWKDIPLS